MANFIAPRGFVPSRYLDGSAWNGAVNTYFIAAADSNAFYPGDAVKTAATSDANGVPGITKITNGTDAMRGVVIGFLLAPPYSVSFQGTNIDLTVQSVPATKAKDYYALVVDDPDVLFEIQDDGLAALTATAVNKNATFTVAAPTAPIQNSATVLSTASVATTNTLNLRIFGLMQRDNNTFGINAKWLVKINLHELQGGTAGI